MDVMLICITGLIFLRIKTAQKTVATDMDVVVDTVIPLKLITAKKVAIKLITQTTNELSGVIVV